MRTREIATVAVFSATIVATNFALTDIPNVKLLDSLVFVASFAYGFRVGAAVGMTSELVWGVVSPYGFGAYIIPFLIIGELLYAAAGSIMARAQKDELHFFSVRNVTVASIMATCAFLWDLETNFGTALIVYGPGLTFDRILSIQVAGLWFMIVHEASDFLLGLLMVPVLLVYLSRMRGSVVRPVEREMLVEVGGSG